MGKNKKNKTPFVSVCTPTFNRRPFIPIIVKCFLNQTYPRDRMEWIILDDGTDPIEDIIKSYNIPQIKYIKLPSKISLGHKRNMMHKHATGSIIVYMDDDDYYPPERVSHAVETLQANPKVMIVGSSEMYVYFKHINKMYQSGPFGQNHSTAATFAFRVELLKDTKYEDHAALAEEKVFLKNYTVPMAQLDPLKTILVFSHDQNTFDKRTLLEMGQNPTFKESNKTVPMFIRTKDEKPIMEFFLRDIDEKLKQYAPGEPINKPDVLHQIKEIEATRATQMAQMKQNGDAPPQKIMLQRPGETPVELAIEDILKILQTQQDHIKSLLETVKKQENQIRELLSLRLLSCDDNSSPNKPQTHINSQPTNPVKEHCIYPTQDVRVPTSVRNKSEPEIYVPV